MAQATVGVEHAYLLSKGIDTPYLNSMNADEKRAKDQADRDASQQKKTGQFDSKQHKDKSAGGAAPTEEIPDQEDKKYAAAIKRKDQEKQACDYEALDALEKEQAEA